MADLFDSFGPLPPASASDLSDSARDIIAIKNLQLPYGVIAPDVWGQPKEQPALVSVNLLLHGGFGSAAGLDNLDDSTIHYGTLAKRIRARCKPNQTADELSQNVDGAIVEMGEKGSGEMKKFIVAKGVIEVALPKASMYGDGVTLTHATTYDRKGKVTSLSKTFGVQGVKIMTLIGVNSYERSQKQPLVASIVLHLRPEAQTASPMPTVTLFNLEQVLVQIIQNTSFETLETLANFTVSQLRERMLDSELPGTRVRLRIEKPRAIAFADAPAVEVVRDVPFAKGDAAAVLNVSKPYNTQPLPQQQ